MNEAHSSAICFFIFTNRIRFLFFKIFVLLKGTHMKVLILVMPLSVCMTSLSAMEIACTNKISACHPVRLDTFLDLLNANTLPCRIVDEGGSINQHEVTVLVYFLYACKQRALGAKSVLLSFSLLATSFAIDLWITDTYLKRALFMNFRAQDQLNYSSYLSDKSQENKDDQQDNNIKISELEAKRKTYQRAMKNPDFWVLSNRL